MDFLSKLKGIRRLYGNQLSVSSYFYSKNVNMMDLDGMLKNMKAKQGKEPEEMPD